MARTAGRSSSPASPTHSDHHLGFASRLALGSGIARFVGGTGLALWRSGSQFPWARVPLLRVPSVIIAHEPNVLINPSHPDAARITVVDQTQFVFDLRLLR